MLSAICWLFFYRLMKDIIDPSVKYNVNFLVAATLEQMTVVEKISDDALIFHQVHKRIWPTAQRDALFWSHMTHITDPNDHDAHDIWAVVNNSTQLPKFPVSARKHFGSNRMEENFATNFLFKCRESRNNSVYNNCFTSLFTV